MEHAGHRKRLIEKLEKGMLHEHEVLEALLFNAVPRKNTNDLAHRLLAEFGSVPAVLEAPISLLKKVDGVGESVAAYIKCVEETRSGNKEFAKAKLTLKKEVDAYRKHEEVDWFCETYLDTFNLTLDELE